MNDWDRMVTFYSFPREHATHIRAMNVVESPFNAVRLRTNAVRRYKKVGNATAMIWKLLRVAEKRFNTLKGAEKLEGVYEGRM
jgi:transposase-like protein